MFDVAFILTRRTHTKKHGAKTKLEVVLVWEQREQWNHTDGSLGDHYDTSLGDHFESPLHLVIMGDTRIAQSCWKIHGATRVCGN